MFTTAGATRVTALTTVREYASSKAESSSAAVVASASPAGFVPAPGPPSFKRKSIRAAFSFESDAIVMNSISSNQTSSQLHVTSAYT
jgi:hypothetical protein